MERFSKIRKIDKSKLKDDRMRKLKPAKRVFIGKSIKKFCLLQCFMNLSVKLANSTNH